MQFTNMSYPDWTHGEYAILRFGTDNLYSHDGNDSSLYVTARVLAVHANLNCSLIGHYSSDTYINVMMGGFQYEWLPVEPRPLGCDTPPEWNHTTGQRKLYLQKSWINYDEGSQYYLTLLDDNYYALVQMRDHHGIPVTSSIRVCGDDRQHYFIGLGGTERLSVLHCVPYVEALWVTAAFSLPHLSLITTMPIMPDTGSTTFLSDSASMTAFPYSQWIPVFTALMNGSSGIGHLAGLVPGPDDNDGRRLIAAVEGILAEYLAQNMNLHYRHFLDGDYQNYTSTLDYNPFNTYGQPANGTVTDRTRLRLVQNEVSTRILQGLLGVMALCLVAESIMVRGGRVIPRDPGSIASRMAYFADGNLWQHVPVGADRWTDEEIIKWGRENSEAGLLLDWWGSDDRQASQDEASQLSKKAGRFAVDSVSRERKA